MFRKNKLQHSDRCAACKKKAVVEWSASLTTIVMYSSPLKFRKLSSLAMFLNRNCNSASTSALNAHCAMETTRKWESEEEDESEQGWVSGAGESSFFLLLLLFEAIISFLHFYACNKNHEWERARFFFSLLFLHSRLIVHNSLLTSKSISRKKKMYEDVKSSRHPFMKWEWVLKITMCGYEWRNIFRRRRDERRNCRLSRISDHI